MELQACSDARVLNAIKERAAGGDALGAARRMQCVASVLLTQSYRGDVGEWAGRDPQHESRVDRSTTASPTRRRAACHCDDADLGLTLICPSVVGEKSKKEEAVAAGVGTSRRQRSHTTTQETRQTEKSHD